MTLDASLRAFALALPDAWEDHPWGEEGVAKVGKKIFVFFGATDVDGTLSFSVKLPDSHDEALALPFTRPTGYGLEGGYWVTALAPADAPREMLLGWVEESYRAVAPRALVARLDAERARNG